MFVGFLYFVLGLCIVGSLVGRVLEYLYLGFCIRVVTPLKCLFLFYLFFADKKKSKNSVCR